MKTRLAMFGATLALMAAGTVNAQNDDEVAGCMYLGDVAALAMQWRQAGGEYGEFEKMLLDNFSQASDNESLMNLLKAISVTPWAEDVESTVEAKQKAIQDYRDIVLIKAC